MAADAHEKPEPKAGIAKVRKEPLKNVPDKKIIHRGKDYRSRITSRVQTSGVTKRPQASRANLGSRVAALLKPKADKKKKEDLAEQARLLADGETNTILVGNVDDYYGDVAKAAGLTIIPSLISQSRIRLNTELLFSLFVIIISISPELATPRR